MPKRKKSVTGDVQRKRNAEAHRLRRQRHIEEVLPEQEIFEEMEIKASKSSKNMDLHIQAQAQGSEVDNMERNEYANLHQKQPKETQDRTERRRNQKAEWHRQARAQERKEETQRRRNEDAEWHREARAQETKEETQRRRNEDAEYHQQARAQETKEETQRRRNEDAEYHQQARAQETKEETHSRRNEDAEWHRQARAQETKEEAQRRKSQDAKRHRQVPLQETIQVREERLRSNRMHHAGNILHNAARCGMSANVLGHICGAMDGSCQHCGGLFFPGELNTRKRYMCCCHGGKIVERQRNYPQELQDLMIGNHALSKDFFKKIRNYNSALSFASLGANINLPSSSGPYCFKIHGAIYHKTSHLRPLEPGREQYAQLYILDSDVALKQRMRMMENVSLNEDLLSLLDSIIRNVNPYAKAYKMLKEFEEDTVREQGAEAAADICMYIKSDNTPGDEHRGRYNAPKENEIAAIFKSIDGAPPFDRDIAIHSRRSGLINISPLNKNLEPMTYVLFYPHGEQGFEIGHNYTELQFYSHRVSVRQNCFNPVLYGRKLFQQYIVDSYVKVEGNRLTYLRKHQKNIRVDTYMGLADHIYRVAEETGAKCGVPIILPSTFLGSPRNMQQNYQDCMAIVRDFGKPDLFLTFTCNPKWPEIIENLLPGQKAYDRPDIVSRVFDLKKKALLEDLTQNHILGNTVAHIHVIEFQKRGLPHMHLLLILGEEDKVRNAESIDTLVCAEIPDITVDPVLHNIVTSSMIHGPCGILNQKSPCMIDGVCSKGFPKPFRNETTDNVEGYPLYRRRDNGNYILIKKKVIDNRWIVPYNPFLTKKYNAHINLEVCSSIKSVKYLFKYVYKGHDAAKVVLEHSGDRTIVWDEIKNFLNARYVSAPEAIWRLFEKKMHAKSHTVFRLPVHLDNLQPVYFTETKEREALQGASDRKTMLTGWFDLNVKSPEANDYLYTEIPKHFTWKNYAWHNRFGLGDNVISRMYSVSPKDIERFHLRLLLCHCRGAKSFSDLRTYENVEYSSFKDACRARHLLRDDAEWKNCLSEATVFQMPCQLRQLFGFICVFCNPVAPHDLWTEFKESLSEDFAKSYSLEDSFTLALRSLDDQLKVHNLSLSTLCLPQPSVNVDPTSRISVYDVQFEKERAEELKKMLNPEQKFVFDSVLEAVENGNPNCSKMFCVNAFAGAGKTFLFRTILHAARGKGFVAVPVSWTGISAVLLTGGRTVHSTFKLPVPILENSSCHVKEDSIEGTNLKASKIIIWDECTMTPYHALDAVDRFLRDLTRVDVPFGGKVVLLGGDWRQTLPVILHGNRTSSIENCLRNSFLWPHFKQFALTRNMRLRPEELQFSKWLIQLGDGRLTNDSGLEEDVIEIPPSCIVKGSLVDEIYGFQKFDSHDLANKTILCPKNDESLKLNEKILARFPGKMYSLYSADSIVCDNAEEQDSYQLDFIHTLTPSGMPPHCLNLKVGVTVMLLRNLDPLTGLCNGTRLIIKNIMSNVLDCEVITGQNAGSRVFIPRMELSNSDSNLPFHLKRRQFPVRLAFSMTISKSQGQTFQKIGIYLPQPVFSHGMLYVAFSRCTSMNNVRVAVKNTNKQGRLIRKSNKVFTKNVVYREIFQ